MSSRQRRRVLAVAVACALGAAGFGAGRWSQLPHVNAQTEDTGRAAASQAPAADSLAARAETPPSEGLPDAAATRSGRSLPSFANLAESAAPAVVNIKVVAVEKASQRGSAFDVPGNPFDDDSPMPGFRMPFPAPPQGGFTHRGAGSGFVIRSDGVVLTNNHVVENAKEITVTLSDKREYPAKVLGRDPKTDLAVLKIDAKGDLPAARLGDSDAIRVGDWVMAIGNPFGLSNTVTAGIVSAKGRVIGAGPYDDFIQTDASINPGNSGGPLFNERGEVVGINSMIFSQSGGNVGIGFAIPINLARKLVPELEESGHVTRGWLGVSIQAVTPELASSLGLDTPHGALVADVTAGSPADKAGIQRGDVIVEFGDKKIDESSALPALVAATPLGKSVPVEVVRSGKTRTLDVTVAKLAEEVASNDTTEHKGKWGLVLRDLNPAERSRLDLKPDEGALVTEVVEGSPAADADVHAGDVILQVNQSPVRSAHEVQEQAAKVTGTKPLLLLVRPAEGGNRFAALAAR